MTNRTGDNAGDECWLVESDLDVANGVQQNSDDDDVGADLKPTAVHVRHIAQQMQQRAQELWKHNSS